MKKPVIFIVAILIVVSILATTAFPWRSIRSAQKGFERAWSAYSFNRIDGAKEHFAKAADSFASALAENPPSRTTMFPSNLNMAGISFYFSGRYQDCIDTMKILLKKDKQSWEAPLYSALSYARMNEQADALKQFEFYLDQSPSQPIISNAVKEQITALENTKPQMDGVADTIENALKDQYESNLHLVGRTVSNENEKCDGAFWWRYNRRPCENQVIKMN